MPVTIHELAVEIHERRGDDIPDNEFTGHFYFDAGLNMFGGCEGCGASLAAYNAHPSRSGYWRCGNCIGSFGYEDIDSAYRHVHLGEPHPAPPVRHKPEAGHWEIPGGHMFPEAHAKGDSGPRGLSATLWLFVLGRVGFMPNYYDSMGKGHEDRKGGPPITRWNREYGHYVR